MLIPSGLKLINRLFLHEAYYLSYVKFLKATKNKYNEDFLNAKKYLIIRLKNLKFLYMLGNIVYETLEKLSKGQELSLLQNTFNTLLTELAQYLDLQPLYQDIIIHLLEKKKGLKEENVSILDFGVERSFQNGKLKILLKNENFSNFSLLPFVLFREACYCFTPKDASELVKICINQIVENILNRLSASKKWKKLIRDNLVNKYFIKGQFNKLEKFFKIEPNEPFESTIQFFFREIREKALLSHDGNISQFYDILFENYEYKTSRSLFDKDIVETLSILVQLFYENKLYLNISDYRTLFRESKQNLKINSELSLRTFSENMQWINKCTPIAPSYDFNYKSIGLCSIIGNLKFNPLLERSKVKKLIEEWPFYHSLKFSENSFVIDLSLIFIIPEIYLKDFLNYLNILEESGYIIKKELYLSFKKESLLNLNYFTEISNLNRVIDPNHAKYENKYEIEYNIEYATNSDPPPLSIFEFIILDRVRSFSVTGLTFDKRIETLNSIKEDVENEIRKQKAINKLFKDSLEKIAKYKSQFLEFLEKNENHGLFYICSQLSQLLNCVKLLKDFLDKHPEVNNIYQLQESLTKKAFSQNIENYLLVRNEIVKKIGFHDLFSLYFRSMSSFEEEIEKLQNYYYVLNSCYEIKIFKLNYIKRIVQDPKLAEEIYLAREKRYKKVFKPISLYKITNEKIETNIEALLNHDTPVLKPLLISTILTSTFAKYYPELIIENTPEMKKRLKGIQFYFPRIFIWEISDLNSKSTFLYVLLYFLNIKEKGTFLSIFFYYFQDSIITFKRYFWRGLTRMPKIAKEFYDFEKKQYFYTKDLFEQLLTYSQKVLGKKLEWPQYSLNDKTKAIFWSKNQNFNDLINKVKKRISHQRIDFKLRELDYLLEFIKNLKSNLLNSSKFNQIKGKIFFQRYIKSIKLLPLFRNFGFSQYYLYFRPYIYKSPTFEVDFRLLFINSFQNIKYPACIEHNQPIFTEFVFPFRTPNKTYLNWLVKSKKIVSEYCLFYKKKFYEILHFNRNLTKEGWNYSSIIFKSYMQNILFNEDYDPKNSEIREFDINKILNSNVYSPNSKEYNALTNIYNIKSIDIKSYLGTRNYTIINNITELLKKKLIFPYISLKNLDFQDKISIILPDVKQEFNKKIIKIFSFFNMCRIYEIEGEFFIYGFEKERVFENGLLIEIWFPKCELDEFFNVFDLLFQYLEIKHYIILTDLVNGKTLLKSIYGNLDFLKEYSPLLNFKWNDKDKMWMNHKLFNEKFEPIYPDLIKKEKG